MVTNNVLADLLEDRGHVFSNMERHSVEAVVARMGRDEKKWFQRAAAGFVITFGVLATAAFVPAAAPVALVVGTGGVAFTAFSTFRQRQLDKDASSLMRAIYASDDRQRKQDMERSKGNRRGMSKTANTIGKSGKENVAGTNDAKNNQPFTALRFAKENDGR